LSENDVGKPPQLTSAVICGYYVGALGVIWSVMWFFLVYNSPAQHSRISDRERQYIEKALNKKADTKVCFSCTCHAHFCMSSWQVPLTSVTLSMYDVPQRLKNPSLKKLLAFTFLGSYVFTGRQRSCKPCTSYRRQAVCLSVRLSVTRWHWVKTTRARITKSSPTDSPRTLVFGLKNSSRNSKGFTPSEGVKWEWGRENSQFLANKSPYLTKGAR